MAPRLSVETYHRLRARVDDGRIACGSSQHVALVDFEQAVKSLDGRQRKIVGLALRGWRHATIADEVGLSRSRVSHLLGDFLLAEFMSESLAESLS